MIKIELPVYYNTGKKTVLVSSNFTRNAHYHILNKLKQHYHKLVADRLKEFETIKGQYRVSYVYYYKNSASDGSNVVSGIEKYLLDAIQEIGLVTNDNVQYHIGSKWDVGGQDKDNPRMEVCIRCIDNEMV